MLLRAHDAVGGEGVARTLSAQDGSLMLENGYCIVSYNRRGRSQEGRWVAFELVCYRRRGRWNVRCLEKQKQSNYSSKVSCCLSTTNKFTPMQHSYCTYYIRSTYVSGKPQEQPSKPMSSSNCHRGRCIVSHRIVSLPCSAGYGKISTTAPCCTLPWNRLRLRHRHQGRVLVVAPVPGFRGSSQVLMAQWLIL